MIKHQEEVEKGGAVLLEENVLDVKIKKKEKKKHRTIPKVTERLQKHLVVRGRIIKDHLKHVRDCYLSLCSRIYIKNTRSDSTCSSDVRRNSFQNCLMTS